MFDEVILMKSIEELINESIKKSSNKIADKLESALKNPRSDYYERTGEVIKAFRNPPKVKIESNGDLHWSFLDFDKIISKVSNKESTFNHHMNLDRGITWNDLLVKELVPVWLNDGFKIPSGAYFKGLNYVQDALGSTDVDAYVEDLIKDAIQELELAIIK